MIDPKATYTIALKDRSRAAAKSFGRNLRTISGKVLNLKTLVVGLAGVGGFGLLLKSSFSTGDALAKTSDKIGITTERLAALHHLTGLYSSASAPAMTEALTKATKRLGEFNATGGGAAARWLETLNLNTKELARLAPDQLFERYATSIRGLNDRGQQLAAISALMGDESRALIGVIDAGSEAFHDATVEVEALGIAMSRADTAKLEAANDAFFRLQQAIKGVSNRIAIGLAPWMEALTNFFVDSAKGAEGWGETITATFENIALAAGYVGNSIHAVRILFKSLVLVGTAALDLLIVPLEKVAQTYIGLRLLLDEDFRPPPGILTLAEVTNVTGKQIAILTEELTTLTGQEWPADKVTAFFNKIRTDAEAAGQKVAETRAALQSSAEGVPIEEDPAVLRAIERNERIEALYTSHLERLQRTDEAAIASNRALWDSGLNGRLQLMGGVMGKMSALMLSQSKKQFAIGKLAAKGQAVVDTYLAAQKAYAAMAGIPIIGPALGAAAAIAAVLAGKARVDAINRTQFGGGGVASVGGGGVAVGSVPPGGVSNPPTGTSPTTDAPTTQTWNVTLTGGTQSSEEVRDLMELMNQELGDGVELNVTVDYQ